MALFSISPASAPTAAQRAGLADRLAQLNAWLAPAGVEAIRKHVSLVVAMLWLKNEFEEELRLRKNGYLYPLSRYPAFAVEQACVGYGLRAEDGNKNRRNPEFLPMVTELCIKARQAMGPLENERADICRILQAKVLQPPTQKTDDAKERVRASLARFRASSAEAAARDAAAKLASTEAGRRFTATLRESADRGDAQAFENAMQEQQKEPVTEDA